MPPKMSLALQIRLPKMKNLRSKRSPLPSFLFNVIPHLYPGFITFFRHFSIPILAAAYTRNTHPRFQ